MDSHLNKDNELKRLKVTDKPTNKIIDSFLDYVSQDLVYKVTRLSVEQNDELKLENSILNFNTCLMSLKEQISKELSPQFQAINSLYHNVASNISECYHLSEYDQSPLEERYFKQLLLINKLVSESSNIDSQLVEIKKQDLPLPPIALTKIKIVESLLETVKATRIQKNLIEMSIQKQRSLIEYLDQPTNILIFEKINPKVINLDELLVLRDKTQNQIEELKGKVNTNFEKKKNAIARKVHNIIGSEIRLKKKSKNKKIQKVKGELKDLEYLLNNDEDVLNEFYQFLIRIESKINHFSKRDFILSNMVDRLNSKHSSEKLLMDESKDSLSMLLFNQLNLNKQDKMVYKNKFDNFFKDKEANIHNSFDYFRIMSEQILNLRESQYTELIDDLTFSANKEQNSLLLDEEFVIFKSSLLSLIECSNLNNY